MPNIVSFYSCLAGAGNSHTTANVAAVMASEGQRVAVLDTDMLSAGVHARFGLDLDEITYTFHDYLSGRCAIEQTAYDVTHKVDGTISGQVFLVPASIEAHQILSALKGNYDVDLIGESLRDLQRALSLDALLIDTRPLLDEETLFAIAVSDVVAMVLRPEQEDFQCTGVAIDVARKLGVPRLVQVLNKVPDDIDVESMKSQMELIYECGVAAVLPNAEEMEAPPSAGIFAMRHPDHAATGEFKQLAAALTAQ